VNDRNSDVRARVLLPQFREIAVGLAGRSVSAAPPGRSHRGRGHRVPGVMGHTDARVHEQVARCVRVVAKKFPWCISASGLET
jgi:hypothetical protein